MLKVGPNERRDHGKGSRLRRITGQCPAARPQTGRRNKNVRSFNRVIEMFSGPRVLFICVHNGGRSQMCEAFLKHYAGDRFDARSAGLEPGELNSLVVEAMAEIGIDISQNKTKSVFDVWKSGEV